MGLFAYSISINNMKQKLDNEIANGTEQFGRNIEMRLEKISYYTDFLFANGEIQEIFTDFRNGKPESEISKKRDIIGMLFYKEPYLETAIIFGNQEKSNLVYKNSYLIDVKKIREGTWVKDTLDCDGKINWIGMEMMEGLYGKRNHVLTLSRAVKDIKNFRPMEQIGYIYISFSKEILTDSYLKDDVASAYIIDQKGRMLSSNNYMYFKDVNSIIEPKYTNITGNKVTKTLINGKQVFVCVYNIPNYNWKVMKILPISYVTSQTNYIAIATGLIIVLCILGMYVLSFFISRKFASPLIQLNNVMKCVEKGEFDVAIAVTSYDEIGQIQKRFNKMVINLKDLFLKTIQIENEKRIEEIKSLQYQINPHFLYNTLNSIRLMATMIKAESITEMTGALIRLLKNAIGKVGNEVALVVEIQNVKDFIYIQQIRYNDLINLKYDFDDDCLDLLVPNFILQPVVENSIFHGIIPQNTQGSITISAKKENEDLLVEVKDDGKGMTDEDKNSIFAEKTADNSFVHIGLNNVNQRIKLNYGEKYGVSIHSEIGVGTTVVISLPVIKKGE